MPLNTHKFFLIACVFLLGVEPVVANSKANNAQKLAAMAQVQGPRRIIVGLSGHMGAVNGVKRLRNFRHVPFIVVEAGAPGIQRLAAMPQVTSLQEDIAEPPALNESIAQIDAGTAWSGGYDGSGWAVAVLDTGLDSGHPWFGRPGKIVAEACFSTHDSAAESLCPDGADSSLGPGTSSHCPENTLACEHGTHVSGIAVGHPGTGDYFGVARGANLVSIQVFSHFGPDGCGGQVNGCVRSYLSDQIAALEHVLDLSSSIDIAAVNMSLGGFPYSDMVACDAENEARKAAVDALAEVGIPVIAASGNDSRRNALSAPACISSVISVGGVTASDAVMARSNIAATLDFLAPGESIDSAYPGGLVVPLSGTSMATSHLAGAWTVLRQRAPAASLESIYEALVATATLVDDQRSGGVEVNLPRINLGLALAEFPALQPEFDSVPIAGSSIDHGAVLVGQSGNGTLIEVSNTGVDPLAIACSISGDNADQFAVEGCQGPLAPGAMQNVVTRCSPESVGLLEATLVVTNNDEDENPVEFPLICEGFDDVLFDSGFEP